MIAAVHQAAPKLLEHALAFADAGWEVFPLQQRAKIPYEKTRGHLEATTDTDLIRRWWAIAPNSNIGLRPPEGILVVDVDPRNNGVATLRALESLPVTLTARTGSGGMHALYTVPPGLSWPAQLGDGVDLKSRSGYIVAPHSIHPSGEPYAWIDPHAPIVAAPPWLVTRGTRRAERGLVVVDEDEGALLAEAEVTQTADLLVPLFQNGKKHALAFALGGWLRQRGWNSADVARLVRLLPSTDTRARVKDALDGYRARNDHGWHAIKQLIGETAAAALDAGTRNPRRAVELAERESATAVFEAVKANAPSPVPAAATLPPASQVTGLPEPQTEPEPLKESGTKPLTTADVVNVMASGVWAGVLGYDALANRVVCLREPPMRAIDNPGTPCVGEWTDAHTTRARTWICQAKEGREPGKDATDAAVEIVARRLTYHPVQIYLASLRWDGVPRLDGLLHRYFGAEASEYTRQVGAKTLIAAVGRATRPGCKVDTMLILEGAQGIGKSRAVRALAGDAWFADTPLDLESKDAAQCLQGKWLYEIGELHSFNRTETTRIKAFVSSQSDNLRPSYGRRNQDFPRQCIFVGTTNGTEYLSDTTGNRRYWPVRCRRIDITALQADRDQLWAEAAWRYAQGERWWLEGAEAGLAEAQQADREAVDPWEAQIAAWIDPPDADGVPRPAPRENFTMAEVLFGALRLGIADQTQAAATRAGKLIAKLGWRTKAVKDPATKKVGRRYVRAES